MTWLAVMSADLLLLAARFCLAAVFLVSAYTKFSAPLEEVKVIAQLHLPAPRMLERLAGFCESIGGAALVLGILARTASVLLICFMLFISFAILNFWSGEEPPQVRAQKRSAFFANIAVIGGLIYLAVIGPGRIAIGNY
jgi:putative oxidoreductase